MRTRPPLVGRGGHQRQALQRSQPGREDRRGDAVDRLGQLAEREVAVEQRPDHPQAPAVADAPGGGVETGSLVGEHAASLESLAIR